MATRIQLRRDTAANWTSHNPVLLSGEIGIETDTDMFKIGDGSTPWITLLYHGDNDSVKYYEFTSGGSIDPSKKSIIVRFQGSNDITQVLPDITKVQEGMRIYFESLCSGEVRIESISGQQVVGETAWSLDNGEYAEVIADKDALNWQLGTNSFTIKDHGSTVGGIEFDDGVVNAASIKKVNLKGIKITKQPEQGLYTDAETELTSGVDVHMSHDSQYGNALTNRIKVVQPLSVYDDPASDIDTGVILEIEHDAYEFMHKPTFLAYLSEGEEIVGKIPTINNVNTVKSHRDGSLWFDNIVWPNEPYIELNKTNKSYGIQEADSLDPNVSGGTDYLIAFRVHMRGKAPDDGFVRAYLYNKSINPFEPTGYLEDVNSQPMAVERHYKAGEELGYLDLIGVVNAKGLQEFSCHAVDNFENDFLFLTDRTEGATGLMIQALTSEAKTGDGLQQFELDTNQNIEFSSHYLGVDRMSLDWLTQQTVDVEDVTAGNGETEVDGLHTYPLTNMKSGIQDGYLIFQDNGSEVCDFNFGKIFSAEETQMMRGKEITVTTTLADKDSGWNVALVKWIGKPDEYTPEIFTARNVTPTYQANWEEVDKLFISEDGVVGDHTETKDFTVPSDANNYAIIIYPVAAQSPMTLKLKQLQVDVKIPFIGYVIHAPELLNELHLYFDEEYKQFIQDNQGYASLRYTINNTDMPAPCGIPGKGAANIDINTNYNKVAGSGARGGEGVIEFKADGDATITTQLRLWNEQVSASTTSFWWAEVSGTEGSPVYTKIDDSEGTFTVPAGAKGAIFRMPTLNRQVENGDKLALRMTTDSLDGAFLESTDPNKPMVSVNIKLKELSAASADDPNAVLDTVRAARLTAGDTIYDAVLRGSKEFPSASSANITFTNLPTGSIPRCVGAFKKIPSGGVQSTTRVEQKFENNILTVSFGETAETIVMYEIWS